MAYGSSQTNKYEYATNLVAALTYLILKQRDAAGIAIFDDSVQSLIPSRTNPAHLFTILNAITRTQPRKKTNIGKILHQVAETVQLRGIVMIVSDFFDNVDEILSSLQHIKHYRHDIILFHIMDEYELSFPFDRTTRFEGLEGYPDILADTKAIRQAYIEEVTAFVNKIKHWAFNHQVDYVMLKTSDPLDIALSTYLSRRLGTKIKLRR
jgi:uncharacterized protein (DUF58 family)